MRKTSASALAGCALLLSACGAGDTTGADTPATPGSPAPAAPGPTAPDPATAPPDGPTEAGLRITLAELADTSRTADFAKTFTFYSPRCQAMISEEDFVELLTRESVGRDYSGDPTHTIDINGPVAQVITEGADGKSAALPKTWTYADGRWQFDNC